MYEKALLFGDHGAAERITHVAMPADAKALGRSVKGFDEKVWELHRESIVESALRKKLEHSPSLKQKLLGTGTSQIAETTPYDRIWGVGLTAEEARATPRADWPGLNLLGEAWMRVRDTL